MVGSEGALRACRHTIVGESHGNIGSRPNRLFAPFPSASNSLELGHRGGGGPTFFSTDFFPRIVQTRKIFSISTWPQGPAHILPRPVERASRSPNYLPKDSSTRLRLPKACPALDLACHKWDLRPQKYLVALHRFGRSGIPFYEENTN